MQRLANWQERMPSFLLYSLRAKLLLFSLLLVVVPGVVFALIVIASMRSALEDAVGRQLAQVAHDTASQFGELLTRERGNVAAWANQDVMREIRIGRSRQAHYALPDLVKAK